MQPLNEVAEKMVRLLVEAAPHCPGPLSRRIQTAVQEYRGDTCTHSMVDTVRGVDTCMVCRSVL